MRNRNVIIIDWRMLRTKVKWNLCHGVEAILARLLILASHSATAKIIK